jgi:hypothetical protein
MVFSARRVILAAVPLALAGAGWVGCGADHGPARPSEAPIGNAETRLVELPSGDSVRLPVGWQLLHERITGVVYPIQALAASSYPVSGGHPPKGGCAPGRVLDARPTDGALIQVIEWSQRAGASGLKDIPERPRPFALPDDAYASYECAGPSYNVAFRDAGRSFQAFVWLDPEAVDPLIRQQATDFLSSMRFVSASSSESNGLQACEEPEGRAITGYGWSAEVNGISCGAVGQFIQKEIFPRAGQIATEDRVQAAGFECDVSELTEEPGWRVACERADRRFVFNWTP